MPFISQENKNSFVIDPAIVGFDTNFWKTITGVAPTVVSNKLRFNADEIASFSMYDGYGDYEFQLNIPADPTAGDARSWGLKDPALSNRSRVEFDITGAVFSANVYDNSGTLVSSVPITWNSASWKAVNTKYRFSIGPRFGYVKFFINDAQVALVDCALKNVTLPRPLHVNNGNADNMDLAIIIVQQAENIT